MRSSAPATRQAAGARAAWSQPFNPPPTRPRCSGDAGSLGRQSVTADQKAGVEGKFRNINRESHKAQVPTLSRKRPANFNNSDGQAGSPPPQSPPNLVWIRGRGRGRTRGKPRHLGVPGMALCRKNATTACRAPHKVHAGLPREARSGLLFRLRGRPPAHHRHGRSPFNQPTSDHADGATLGRWDAKASQRTRRPGLTVPRLPDPRPVMKIHSGPSGPLLWIPLVGPR